MVNTSDIIMDTLEDWGVDTIFGLPGDGINGLMEALRQRQDRIRFVLVRHEEAAAFAAAAYAKFTGKIGVCLATTGPGGIHLLNGLYDAKMDNAPVLAITGQTYSDLAGSHYQQDVNMVKLMSDVAEFNEQVNSAEHAGLATDIACRTALSRLAVAHITVPIDVQEKQLERDYTKRRKEGQSSNAPALLPAMAQPAAIAAAADILNSARKPVILAGAGARGASQELLTLAERLQAPIIKALLGKDVIPDDHPLSLGGLGLLGTAPSERAMEDCDAVLLVGTNFPYTDYLPDPGQARGVQIDVNPVRIGLRVPVEVGLVGGAKETLQALLPHVEARGRSEWLSDLQGEMVDWWGLMEDRGTRDEMPMKPQFLARELNHHLRDDAILCGDSGTNTTWLARYIKIRGEQRFSCSGRLASMAPALPYAIAAQTAYPDRQVVAFMGDGALLMLAGELSTIAQHRLPIKVFVVKNNTLGMIKWEQMVFLGNPSYGVDFPPFDYAKIAEGMGIRGMRLERPQDAQSIIQEALAHDGPVLVEAVVDPFEPPHPPKIKAQQAKHMAQALARGQPNASRIGLTLFRDKVKDFFAPRGGVREEGAAEDDVRSRRP